MVQHFGLETEVDVITASVDAEVLDFINTKEVEDEGLREPEAMDKQASRPTRCPSMSMASSS